MAQCTACDKAFFHVGCVIKHKIYNKYRELVICQGLFTKSSVESEKMPMTGDAGARLESVGADTPMRSLTCHWMAR